MASLYSLLLHDFMPLALLLILAISCAHVASAQEGEEARWLVQASKWATMANLENGELKSMVTSIAESDGRIFFYLMEDTTFKGTITLSEAQIDPSQFFGAKCGPDGSLDPQDPRCAKLTISGIVSPVEDESKQLALDSLFAAHPQMASWPEGHGFIPCEMKINEENGLWMIANFGGGGFMNAADYHDSVPLHHAVKGFGGRSLEGLESSSGACYNPSSHECECLAEKCGDALCQGAGGIWTQECSTTCECEPSSSSSSANPATYTQGEPEHGGDEHGGEHGQGNGWGGGHGNGDGMGGHGDHGEYNMEGHGQGDGMMGHGDGGGHGHGDASGGHGHGDASGGHGHGDASGEHGDHGAMSVVVLPMLPRPDFGSDAAGHARWIVAKSLWTTVSTISSSNEGQPFGNIRSTADGACFLSSTGLPYFYLPGPDPTAVDIKANGRIALSFTEAALAERVGSDGNPCGGKDAEDPTCGKLTLIGHAKPLEEDAQIELAKEAFKVQHPRASWLSSGGAHTGGSYYTLDLEEIVFLQNYGGFTPMSPAEYLNWKPDSSKLAGEPQCGIVEESPHTGATSQSTSALTSASTSSISAGVIMIVIIASFIGSLVGGLVSDKVKSVWRNKRSGYAVANSVVVENAIQPGEGDITSKTWV